MTEFKKTILVAEDNDITRILYATILREQGYDVVQATDGRDAIVKYEENIIDLSIVDQMMEPDDGFFFINHVEFKSEKKKAPVIMVTAHQKHDLLSLMKKYKCMKQILTKPVPPKLLTRNLEKIFAEKDMGGASI